MNRYTAAGVLADMRQGRRVLVLSETQNLARLAFAEVAQGVMPDERVRRANGNERIATADGSGWVLDHILPAIYASPVGEVIRP